MSKLDYLSFKPTPNILCGSCGSLAKDTPGKPYKGKTPLKPFYKVFEHVNWFRGDDEYVGKVCHACMKAGRTPGGNKARETLLNKDVPGNTKDPMSRD